MRLIINREIPLTTEPETKLDWVRINNGHILPQRIILDCEGLMSHVLLWLEEHSEFDSRHLRVHAVWEQLDLIYE